MNISCPSCSTRYSVEDHRISPSGVTIKCPKCAHSFVVKKDGQIQSESPVPLPAAPGSAGGAVPLPGASGGQNNPHEESSLFPPGSLGGNLGGPPPMPKPQGKPIGQSGVLNFIDDTANRAGYGNEEGFGPTELRIRRSNGAVEGPYGVQRIVTMLKNGDLAGNEQISKDGRQWSAMSTQPELQNTLDSLAQQSSSGFGAFGDLGGIPSDLPGLRNEGNAPPTDLPGLPQSRAATLSTDPNLSPTGDVITSVADSMAAPPHSDLSSPAGLGGDYGADAFSTPAGSNSVNPGLLDVGEIPQLPSMWDRYRGAIIAAGFVFTVLMTGLITEVWTEYGAFGRKMLFAEVEQTEPPPPPPPPPTPAKLAPIDDIRTLIHEGSFESFRSVLATIKNLGDKHPDNLLAYAKAHAFATLAYGTSHFPLAELRKAVEELKVLDLTKAQGGNAELANLEILKARSALEILDNAASTAAQQLSGAFALNTEDKEVAFLLGLAQAATGENLEALKALDRAIVIDTSYSSVFQAIGDLILKNPDLGKPIDAAWWLEKAVVAQPNNTPAALSAASIYQTLGQPGDRRRMLAAAADGAARGLSPAKRAEVNYNAAIAFQAAGKMKESAKYSTRAAKLDPAETRYIAANAIARIHKGQAKTVLSELAPLVARNANNVPLNLALAEAQMFTGDVGKAFETLDKAKKSNPRAPAIYLKEGRFNVKLGKLEEAGKTLEQAILLSGTANISALLELGFLELRVGNIDGALTHAEKAVSVEAGNPGGHVLLGNCLHRRDELELARKAYKTALKLDPDDLAARLGLANTLRDIGARAPQPKDTPELAQAMPIYIEITLLQPDNANAIFEYGRAFEIIGQLDNALQLYREAAKQDETDARPHLAIVAAYLDSERPDLDAVRGPLKLAGDLAPGKHEVKYWNGRLNFAEGKLDASLRNLRGAVSQSPKNATYHFWLGKVHRKQDSLFEAIDEFKAAIRLNSRLAEAYRSLAWAAIERHKYTEAQENFDNFRKAAPKDHTIWEDIGQMWARQNKEDSAQKAFKKALEHNDSSSVALLGLGNIESRRGNDRKALDLYARAAKADVYNGEAMCQYAIALAN
ncbi:MAG: tetratricopeptide repeat protein, partial [Myxococcota bacterium]|nr:tetratricopeptide repeat protein [Myxococcota bacterium]